MAIWNAGQAFLRLRETQPNDTFRGGCRARALDADARDPWHDEWLALRDPEAVQPLTNLHVHRRVRLPVAR